MIPRLLLLSLALFYATNLFAEPSSLSPEDILTEMFQPGAVIPVKLLAGVNAPVDGTPYPVMLGAEYARPMTSSNLNQKIRLIAAATGVEEGQRVYFRFTHASTALPNGRRIELDIDGYLLGQNKEVGLEGKLISAPGFPSESLFYPNGVNLDDETIAELKRRKAEASKLKFVHVQSGQMGFAVIQGPVSVR